MKIVFCGSRAIERRLPYGIFVMHRVKYRSILLFVLPSVVLSCDFVPATYQTVSESEWSETIEFQVDGSAAIISEKWEAGDHEHRSIEKLSASWSCDHLTVTVRSGSWVESFLYSPQTSYASIGQANRYAPGLQGRCTGDVCKYAGLYFWQVEAIQQLMNAGLTSAELQQELLDMLETDQRRGDIRQVEQQFGYGSPEYQAAWDEQNRIDQQNQQRLAEIVNQAGWPKTSVVGNEAANAAFMIVQHADLATQQHYLPIMQAAVQQGEASASSLALLQDRILMREGKKVLYGTQLRRNEETGGWFLWPIEDEENVDARRARIGMRPLAEELAAYPFEIGPVPEDFELVPVP